MQFQHKKQQLENRITYYITYYKKGDRRKRAQFVSENKTAENRTLILTQIQEVLMSKKKPYENQIGPELLAEIEKWEQQEHTEPE